MDILNTIKDMLGMGDEAVSAVADAVTDTTTGAIETVTDTVQTLTPDALDTHVENVSEMAKDAVTGGVDFVEGVITGEVPMTETAMPTENQ